MVATLHVPGRLILAGGFAIAMAIAPTVAVLADISLSGISVTTADPCTVTGVHGSYSVACKPNRINGNLPSGQDLTVQNEYPSSTSGLPVPYWWG